MPNPPDDALPRYDDLPPAPGGARSAWGLFGPGDSAGLMNLQTPERVAAAAREVRTGEVYALGAPIDLVDPPMYRRGAPRHTVLAIGDSGFDDVIDDFYPQASSQWDSLAHVGFDSGVFYNGASPDDVRELRRNTIDHWARRGIAGRAVLLDVAAVLDEAGETAAPGESRAITVAELEAARERAGVTYLPGDVLLLHTGYLAWYAGRDAAARRAIAHGELRTIGIAHGEEMARYLWDAHVSAIAADNPAVEVWPPDHDRAAWPFGYLHRMLIGQFGMAIGELWWLHDLAMSCRSDGRYTALLTSAPLNVRGGVGSPPGALAIK